MVMVMVMMIVMMIMMPAERRLEDGVRATPSSGMQYLHLKLHLLMIVMILVMLMRMMIIMVSMLMYLMCGTVQMPIIPTLAMMLFMSC